MSTGANSAPAVGVERRLLALVAILLCANPVVIYLLTGHVIAALTVTLVCVGVIQVVLSRAHRLALVLLFNAIVICSVFLHAELILISRFGDRVPPNLYVVRDGYYFNQPFLDRSFSGNEYAVRYRTNAQGFRIAAGHDASRTVSTVDWLVIGDSFTQGAQVEFEELSTTLLYRRFPDRVVLNAGISGLGLGEEYNYFEKEGHLLKPSLVILQLATFNDFMNVEPRGVPVTERVTAVSSLARLIVDGLRDTTPANLPLGRWAEPFALGEQANSDSNIFYKKTSTIKQRELDAFERYVRRFKDKVESEGGKLLLVLIPTREQVARPYLEEVLQAYSIDETQLDMERPNRFLAEITRRHAIAFVDLLPNFRGAGGKLYFDRDEHLTSRGHAVVADAIADFIESTDGRADAEMLSRDFASDRYPMVSQDGKLITYQSHRGRSVELYLADPDFLNARRLTFNDVDESHAMLSKDGSRLVFTEGSAETLQTAVVVASLDQSVRTVVTAASNTFGAIPVFSYSNRSLAYAEWKYLPHTKTYTPPQIVVLDLFLGSKLHITSNTHESWRPVFSPDETQLVYISKVHGQFDLFLYDLRLRVERRLTATPFDEWDPQFAPDGRTLVYSARPDGNWDLFLRDLVGEGTIRLTKTRGDEWDGAFSNDGRALLFGGRFGLVEGIFRRRLGS